MSSGTYFTLARPLAKLKRLLTTIQQAANSVSPEVKCPQHDQVHTCSTKFELHALNAHATTKVLVVLNAALNITNKF